MTREKDKNSIVFLWHLAAQLNECKLVFLTKKGRHYFTNNNKDERLMIFVNTVRSLNVNINIGTNVNKINNND